MKPKLTESWEDHTGFKLASTGQPEFRPLRTTLGMWTVVRLYFHLYRRLLADKETWCNLFVGGILFLNGTSLLGKVGKPIPGTDPIEFFTYGDFFIGFAKTVGFFCIFFAVILLVQLPELCRTHRQTLIGWANRGH
tara:strand:- start:1262 stop:1669 length:408 start_codon:yes stop_codon:yes gene_type:complete